VEFKDNAMRPRHRTVFAEYGICIQWGKRVQLHKEELTAIVTRGSLPGCDETRIEDETGSLSTRKATPKENKKMMNHGVPKSMKNSGRTSSSGFENRKARAERWQVVVGEWGSVSPGRV